jgi:hypothetical protein
MTNTIFQFLLLFTLLLAGFYGGTGFFVVMGDNPAIEKMPSATFAEYWQHTDHFMAARMRIFRPLLLMCVTASSILSFIAGSKSSLNTLIQSWDLNNLPAYVPEIKHKAVHAFWLRSSCMIGVFLCFIFAVWKSKPAI